jgi:hypothetical protein
VTGMSNICTATRSGQMTRQTSQPYLMWMVLFVKGSKKF